jgi:hypothetical protein
VFEVIAKVFEGEARQEEELCAEKAEHFEGEEAARHAIRATAFREVMGMLKLKD